LNIKELIKEAHENAIRKKIKENLEDGKS